MPGYTIEDILEKEHGWVDKILIEIERHRLDEYMDQLRLRGVDDGELQKIKDNFENSLGEKERIEKPVKSLRATINEFQRLGLGIGKPNRTTVINRPGEKK